MLPYKFFLLTLVYLLLSTKIYATTVVLNEFFPNPVGSSESDSEWIELYNKGSSSLDISGFRLDDITSGGSSEYTIPSGTTISPQGFIVFESSITKIILNNTGDTVRLIDETGSEIDTYSYSATVEDISIGRSSNGEGSWTNCASQTKNSSNNCPLATSTVTPTHTPTQTPTHTPTQTPTTSPTKTPTKTPTPTVKKTSTPTPTVNATPTDAPTEDVLGSSDSGEPVSMEPLPLEPDRRAQVMPVVLSLLFVALGLALGAGVLVWKKKMEKQANSHTE